MNKSNLFGLLLFALCFVYHSYAQPTCDQKAEDVLRNKSQFQNFPPELIDELIEYITPCAEESYGKTNPSSAYAKGLLHLQKGDYTTLFGRRKELSYLHIFRAAYYKYPAAMLTHGINLLTNKYKEEYYINYATISNDLETLITQDYKKDIAHYILGYLSLKNLVSNDDFTNTNLVNKAKMHFESSNHPMAKHWLAIMHYFGYGVPRDKAKALQMLSDNDIFNSQTLKEYLQHQNNDWIPISAEERLASLEGYSTNYAPVTVIGSGKTTFQGHFIEYNWPATGVARYIPVTLSITVREEHDTYRKVRLELTMNGETLISDNDLRKNGTHNNELYINFGQFLPLRLPSLENMMQDHPDKNTHTYSIKRLSFKEAIIDGKQALIVKPAFTTKIVELNEEVHTPIRMVLYPEAPTATMVIAASTATDLKEATPIVVDKDFATVSPNPIGDQFNITYTLPRAVEVQTAVYDFYGQQRIQVPGRVNTDNGEQTITIDSSRLPSGTYIIQMTIDGKPYSKMVIKE
ncbi:T9SS type A sorting domain-containing protein [Aquimarina mytili]|uniref:T9SS type A sorting domain-containing protein n=1 Tax=Aquimarina mytili TaxID=874423 RepID=A0A937A6J5_9FLAO|nr:T9SS type A sorting domain-containing protein [Aquimarina mytili]MBL0685790.1 T9SS type A sorting domain-containing protein [Aquimarina mytili]